MMHSLQWMALVHPNYGLPQQLIFTILAYMGVTHWWFSCYEVTCCKLEVTSSNPTRIYLCPMSCGGCGAPRGIVVTGMDPWTPCHASTSPAPVADSPSYQRRRKNIHYLEFFLSNQCKYILILDILWNLNFLNLYICIYVCMI